MKSLMLIGALASSLTPSVQAEAHRQTRSCPSDYHHETNIIDPHYSIGGSYWGSWLVRKACPRYVMSEIALEDAKYFEKMGTEEGEIDRASTYNSYPEWYHDNPTIDPSFNYHNNPHGEHTRPITFSSTLERIYEYNQHVNNKKDIYWDKQTTSAKDAVKVKCTFRDVYTFAEQSFTIYINGGTVVRGRDQLFVSLIPGTKDVVNPNHITVKQPNITYIHQSHESGTYGIPNEYAPTEELVVPALFGFPLTIYPSDFAGANPKRLLHSVNNYSMVGIGGYDNHWGSYVADIFTGFQPIEHTTQLHRNFLQGMNTLKDVVHDICLKIYKKINLY